MLASVPMRGNDELRTYYSKWNVGASGAMTKDSAVPGKGFASVARTAAGKFTVTFNTGVVGELVDFEIHVWRTADAESFIGRPTKNGYTAATASAAATMLYEIWEIDETQLQVDPANGDIVTLKAVFLKTK